MKTYVKIHGPPLLEALDELQKIAGQMPKITHYHFLIDYSGAPTPSALMGEAMPTYPTSPGAVEKVTHPLISKSGHTLGEHDFFFEWEHDPTWSEIRDLISKIDKAFTRLGCKYTLITK